MSDSPATEQVGEALGTLIGLVLTAGIDNYMQQANQKQIARRTFPAIPFRRKLGRVLRRFRLKSPARLA